MARYADDDRAGPAHAVARFLCDEAPAGVDWLWPGRLPLGALSLLIGDPGTGKSLLTADLAARLSHPCPWPDDPPAERPDPATLPPLPLNATMEDVERSYPPMRGVYGREISPTGVVFAAPEDRDVLPARLVAAGADTQRTSVLDGVRPPYTKDVLPLRLPTHLAQLEQAIRAHTHPRLVVLDPLHLLLDDSVFCNTGMQSDLLIRLADLARRKGVAILAVGHFAKTTARRAVHRIRGPLSFAAAARSILLLTIDPNAADRRILTHLKNSNGPTAPPLAFRITNTPLPPRAAVMSGRGEPQPVAGVVRSGARVWHFTGSRPGRLGLGSDQPGSAPPVPESVSAGTAAARLEWDQCTSADWRLGTGELDLSVEASSVLTEACDWLLDFLVSGGRPAREVVNAARAAGLSVGTLRRAKRLLGVRSVKGTGDGGWGVGVVPFRQLLATEHHRQP